MVELLTEYSLWYLVLCVLTGITYAYILYQKKTPWSKSLNYTLFGVRTLIVTLICALLLGPYLKQNKNYYEKPTVVFAIDNSQSVPLVTDTSVLNSTLTGLQGISEDLSQNGYDTEIQLLGENTASTALQDIAFNEGTTNLSDLLKGIQAQYENRNLGGVVLLSDGIYNQGVSPVYSSYNVNVMTVGIGDTLPQVDINLKNLYANKIAYLGNRFPIVAEVINTGFVGKSTEVVLYQNGKVIERKSIEFTQEEGLQTVEFLAEASNKGMQRFTVVTNTLQGEFTQQNNQKNVYIDVLDGKEKILLVAAAPHPDIKAIKSAIEKNKNYELTIHLPTFEGNKRLPEEEAGKYDLIIYHQMPNKRRIGARVFTQLKSQNTAQWFIIGNQSDFRSFNKDNTLVEIIASGRQIDKVTPIYSKTFDRFTFDDDKKGIFGKMPPVTVPFGDFKLLGNSEAILHQRVGTINTDKPLLIVNEQNGIKKAVFVGEGMWQWRLQEYALNDNTEAFDALIAKLVQYLSTKEDKRKFRVYPVSDEFLDTETVFFETEVYNNIYEKIYGQKVDLQVTDEEGESTSYSYVNSRANFKYAINGLTEGIYKYKATTQLNGKLQVSSGEFTIKKLEVEAINTTANFNLLRNLSAQTSGQFYQSSELNQLHEHLLTNKPPEVIHSQEEFEEILNLEWFLVILMSLATVEWVVRKVRGSY